MKEVYVLMCQVWGGSSYSTEVVKVYKDEETAHRTALAYQGRTPKCDVSYYVEKCEYEDQHVECEKEVREFLMGCDND